MEKSLNRPAPGQIRWVNAISRGLMIVISRIDLGGMGSHCMILDHDSIVKIHENEIIRYYDESPCQVK